MGKQEVIKGLEDQIKRLEDAGEDFLAAEKRRFLAAYRAVNIRAYIVPDAAYMRKVGAL